MLDIPRNMPESKEGLYPLVGISILLCMLLLGGFTFYNAVPMASSIFLLLFFALILAVYHRFAEIKEIKYRIASACVWFLLACGLISSSISFVGNWRTAMVCFCFFCLVIYMIAFNVFGSECMIEAILNELVLLALRLFIYIVEFYYLLGYWIKGKIHRFVCIGVTILAWVALILFPYSRSDVLIEETIIDLINLSPYYVKIIGALLALTILCSCFVYSWLRSFCCFNDAYVPVIDRINSTNSEDTYEENVETYAYSSEDVDDAYIDSSENINVDVNLFDSNDDIPSLTEDTDSAVTIDIHSNREGEHVDYINDITEVPNIYTHRLENTDIFTMHPLSSFLRLLSLLWAGGLLIYNAVQITYMSGVLHKEVAEFYGEYIYILYMSIISIMLILGNISRRKNVELWKSKCIQHVNAFLIIMNCIMTIFLWVHSFQMGGVSMISILELFLSVILSSDMIILLYDVFRPIRSIYRSIIVINIILLGVFLIISQL